jgi:DNA-binding protein YbaB
MASYIANNQSRDSVTIMLSKAEAEALTDLAGSAFNDASHKMNGQKRAAAQRALDALNASTNTSARRAGYFDI